MLERLLALLCALTFASVALNAPVLAQSNAGMIRGAVTDQAGAAVSDATVRLTNSISDYSQMVQTSAQGAYQFLDVPFNRYRLTVESPGFDLATREVTVNSNLPQQLNIQLEVAPVRQQVEVQAATDLIDPEKTGPSVVVDRNRILRFPTSQPSRITEEIVATAPGWTLNANGRLHARGIEYQVQYSIDGIPVTDTIAYTFASAPDPRNFRSVEVTTANIPAEYGNKLAGVIAVNSRSGLETPDTGSATISGGSFSTLEGSFDVAGRRGNLGYLASAAGSLTDRFLDPPSIANLHNHGSAFKSFFKIDYAPNEKDLFRLSLFTNVARLDVPNTPDQQLAGQDQSRRLHDNMQSLSWQRIFSEKMVSYVAAFHRYNSASLGSAALATPVFTEQSRHHANFGAIGSLTYQAGRHTVKTGIETIRFPATESFTFAVTDLDALEERVPDLTEETREFTLARPFFFNEQRTGWEGSAYAQDHFNATSDLTLSLGLRFDSYHFLVDGNFVSPRLGAAYHIEKTKTVLRASFDRLIETPALENLLLSSSEKTRLFSPGDGDDTDEGGEATVGVRGAPVPITRSWQVDVGFQQQLTGFIRLDADFYYRRLKNVAELINFLETEIVFPATLARSRSKGVESRLDFAPVRGFSGFISYTNFNIFGEAPVTGGLFLGEALELREQAGRRVKNEEDQRNTVVFEGRYEYAPARVWLALGGRHDSGYSVELEDDVSREDFERRFPAKILDRVNLERGFVKPRTVLNFSVGKEVDINDRAQLSAQFNIQNLTDRFYLITFGSLFTGTNTGGPRSFSGKLSISFK
ncbi:MAG: TonB-dependent receptor [Blastocatellia bacterium]|nr:TonB-dependent receptor [Blastocatellia bacterium]